MRSQFGATGEALLGKALRDVATGKLPAVVPPRVWGGRGSGRACDLCAQPITSAETAIEFEADARHNSFHLYCHNVWVQACRCLQTSSGTAESEQAFFSVELARSRSLTPAVEDRQTRRPPSF
jgi:hypothetical protein